MSLWTAEGKQQQLDALYAEWEHCTKCPLNETRTQVVFGYGNVDAKILLCGEGPGADEDREGYPFVGKSGQLLKSLISEAGIDWDDLYVTNVVGCRPTDEKGMNRDPRTNERDACLPRLHKIIYIVDPYVIVPVGKFALQSLCKGGRAAAITERSGDLFSSPSAKYKVSGAENGAEIVGKFFPQKNDDKKYVHLEYDMMPILHPSYLLREEGQGFERNGEFRSDGPTMKTLGHLKHIKEYIDRLDETYNSLPNFNRRAK